MTTRLLQGVLTARTGHNIDAFVSPKKRKTGMYVKLITFQKVTGLTTNHLCYQRTPDLHPGTAKGGGGELGDSFFSESPFLIQVFK